MRKCDEGEQEAEEQKRARYEKGGERIAEVRMLKNPVMIHRKKVSKLSPRFLLEA